MPPDTTRQRKTAEKALVYYEMLSDKMREISPHADIDIAAVGARIGKSEEPEKPKSEAERYVFLASSKLTAQFERAFKEFRFASSWGWLAQTGQPYTPININVSLDALEKDVAQVKESVNSIETRLSGIESQLTKIVELEESLRSLTNLFATMAKEDSGWLTLSEKSFDFWDNPEDAIYDHL